MFVLRVKSKMQGLKEAVEGRLSSRIKISPKDYSLEMRNRIEGMNKIDYKPRFEAKFARNDSFVFAGVDDLGRRIYKKYSSVPGSAPKQKVFNNRILTISRHMLESAKYQTPGLQTPINKGDVFKNFYKKTVEERLKIVGKV